MSSIGALSGTNHWTSQEYNRTNAWYINFSNGNVNNNNKYNTNVVRPVVALNDQVKKEWIAAFEDCCRHKMTSLQCTLYRLRMEDDLFVLAYEVYSGTYEIGPSVTFCVTVPKLREIFAADFRDRIVQHWIVQRINPFFERRFIAQGNVSYNCRVGYGTLAAVLRIQEEIVLLSENYTIPTYIGIMDISSFFMTIDRDVTWSLLEPFIKEHAAEIVAMYPGTDIDVLLRVTKQTIMNNPQENCVKRGNLDLWDQLIAISPSKSFFSNKTGQGLPIGNITSQLIANFLLSFLDEYIISLCRQVGAVHLRFVDDIAIVARRPEDIVWIRGNVATYMVKVLHQKLHAYKFYLQEVHKGGKFVGSVIKPGRIYTSNRTLGRFQDKVSSLEELCTSIVTEGITLSRAAALEEFIAGINSYFGFTSHTASYNRRMRIFNQQVYFWKVCYLVNASKAKIRKKYKLSTFLIHQEYEEYISHKTSAPRGHSESLPSEGANRQF